MNERHHLVNRIAHLEKGAATYLMGQHHHWQVVPPPCRSPTQSSPAQDVHAEVCFTVMLCIISSGCVLCPNLNTLSVVGNTASSSKLVPQPPAWPPLPPPHHCSLCASQAESLFAALLCTCSVQTRLTLSAKQGLEREQLATSSVLLSR